MSSLTTTTINTKDGITNMTVTTGNTSGPALIISSGSDVWIRANSTANAITANATSVRIPVSANVANSMAVSGAVTLGSTLSVSGAATLSANISVGGNAAITGSVSAQGASITSNTLTLGSSLLADPGYSRLPNGLLMQWGTVTSNSSTGTVTFPAAFTAVYSMTVTPNANNTTKMPGITALSNTTALVRTSNSTATATVYWMAIGV